MTTSLTTRETAGTGATVKGSPLSNAEIDANFLSLNDNKAEITLSVPQDSGTGAAQLPVGTEAERPTAATGKIRFNTTQASFEGYNGTEWGTLGGGGGSVKLTASGAISAGDPVVLNSDGTVSAVELSTTPAGLSQQDLPSGYVDPGSWDYHIDAIPLDSSGRFLFIYRNHSGDGGLSAVVGTYSDGSVVYGTAVSVTSNSTSAVYNQVPSVTYNSTTSQATVIFMLSAGGLYARTMSISGTTITLQGSETLISSNTSTTIAYYFAIIYDKYQDIYLVQYMDNGGFYRWVAVALSIDGSGSYTLGSYTTFGSTLSSTTQRIQGAVAPITGGSLIATVERANTGYIEVNSFTVDPSTLNITQVQNGVQISTTSRNAFGIVYIESASKFIVSEGSSGGSAAYFTEFTLDGSNLFVAGNQIAWYTDYTWYDSGRGSGRLFFDTSTNKIQTVLSWTQYDWPASSGRYEFIDIAYDGNISNSSITSENVYVFPTTTSEGTLSMGSPRLCIVGTGSLVVSDESRNGVVIFAQTPEISSSNVTDSNYLGISKDTYSNAQSATVLLTGSIYENYSGLTIGSSYFVTEAGELSATNNGRKAGRAVAADTLLVDSNLTGPEMNAYLGSLL